MEHQKRTELVYEPLLRNFKTWGDQQLEATPELNALLMVADWKVGRADFPEAHLVLHHALTPIDLLNMLEQVVKAGHLLLGNLQRQLEAAKAAVGDSGPESR